MLLRHLLRAPRHARKGGGRGLLQAPRRAGKGGGCGLLQAPRHAGKGGGCGLLLPCCNPCRGGAEQLCGGGRPPCSRHGRLVPRLLQGAPGGTAGQATATSAHL